MDVGMQCRNFQTIYSFKQVVNHLKESIILNKKVVFIIFILIKKLLTAFLV